MRSRTKGIAISARVARAKPSVVMVFLMGVSRFRAESGATRCTEGSQS